MDIQELITNTTMWGAIAVIAWKMGGPLVQHYVSRWENKQENDEHDDEMENLTKRIKQVEGNHDNHFNQFMDRAEERIGKLEKTVNDMGNRLTRLETIIERNGSKN